MSAPAIITNMVRGWNREPAHLVHGTRRSGVSAALWTHEIDDVQEIDAGGAVDLHVISFQCGPAYDAELFKDGRHVFSKRVQARTISWVEAGVVPRAVHRGPWQVLHLYMPPDLLLGLASELGEQQFEPSDPQCEHNPVVERIAREVLSEMKSDQVLTRLRIDLLGQDLAIELLRRYTSLAGARGVTVGGARGGLAPWQERRCTEYLRDNMAEDVDLPTLAAIANLSPFHFARMFKKSVGAPPHRYQLLLRLERAKALLVETEMSVLQIALAVGYESPQTLARLFQRELGVTPSAYRRERKR